MKLGGHEEVRMGGRSEVGEDEKVMWVRLNT